ncbi:hypothetical protein M2352_001502 [Azospirillum fermentarium]|uniref:hypothetical protein n=1 Tax=Azospirillum fermentarium TaxID=1233114 RepID=UPI002226A757|nr:hypothetical protein [Azospirillum fermentarium]MCW2245911.1 hypothetical protein [Azospirillum fermentarium]
MNPIKFFYNVIYHRLFSLPVLEMPFVVIGISYFSAHQNLTAAFVFIAYFIISFSILSGLLFIASFFDKTSVLSFVEKCQGTEFIRVNSMDFIKYFDFYFLIPSYFRPKKFIAYFAKNYVHVFTVKRGRGMPNISPCAYVSPIAQDVFIFLRDNFKEMNPVLNFKICHELGHGAGMYSVIAKRNLLGLKIVSLSIIWILIVSEWNFWLLSWTLIQVIGIVIVNRTVYSQFHKRQPLMGEVIADYIAIRHLSSETITSLIDSGAAERLVQTSKILSEEQMNIRRRILAEQFERRQRGEVIDVPAIVMADVFSHPWQLIIFNISHFCYLFFFGFLASPTLWLIWGGALIGALLLSLFAMADAQLRIDINRAVSAPADPSDVALT